MNEYAVREWDPSERPVMPGSPSTPNHSTRKRFAFLFVGLLVTLTGGLGNALVTVNLISLQGTLGAYSTETSWLPAVYVMTNASMNLLLVKFRQQFGLRLFTESFLVLYALVTFGHLFVNDLHTAILVRAAHGMVGAALSTLGLYYTLQAFKKEWRQKGMALSMGASQLALPVAYIFSSSLLEFAEWRGLYLFELGLTLFALGAVLMLKLPPGDRFKAFRGLDFVTFALFAPGVALLCAVLTFGRLLWWRQTPWIGMALAGSIALIIAAIALEHNRTYPLLNLRWLRTRNIASVAVSLVLVRVVLSEQSIGAVGFLRGVGLLNDQMQTLFVIVLAGTILGIIVAAVSINPRHLEAPQIIALLLMALGAWMDAHATSVTRPEEMYVSQFLLGFGGALFLGPLVISLIGQVIGFPDRLISFSVMFGLTQNLGGLIGSAALGTFQVVREKYHSSILTDHLSSLDPLVAARIQSGAAAYGKVLADPSSRTAQGVAALQAAAAREANVLAYNDVFLLIFAIALATALWIAAHTIFNMLTQPPATPAPAPAPSPLPRLPSTETVTD